MASDTKSNTIAIQTTIGNSVATMGPISSSLGVDHDNDVIYIWLNPVILGSTAAGTTTFSWTGLASDTCDPYNSAGAPTFYQNMKGCDPNQFPFPDIIGVPVWCLKNPYYPGQGCAQWLAYTSRSWDLSTWGVDPTTGLPLGPGLTMRDYADILQADPFVTLNGNDVNVCHPTYGPSLDPNLPETLSQPIGSPGVQGLGAGQVAYAVFSPSGGQYQGPAACTTPNTASPMIRFQSYGAVEYPVPGPNGLPSTYAGTFQYSNNKANSNTATSSQTVGTNFSASVTFGWCFLACETYSYNASNSVTFESQSTTTADGGNTSYANYSITGPQLSDNYDGPATYNVYLDTVYGTYAFYSDLNPPVSQTALGTIGISPSSTSCASIAVPCTSFGSTAVGTPSAQQTTFTITNESTFPMTMPGPAVTFSDPAFQVVPQSDTCSNTYMQVGQVCYVTVLFSPVLSDVSSIPYGGTQVVTADMIVAGTVNAAAYQNILVANYELVSGTAVASVSQFATLQPSTVQNAANPNVYNYPSTSSTQSFLFTNHSSSSMTIGSLALTDGVDFSISSDQCTGHIIATSGSNSSCTFTLNFVPPGASSSFYSTKITALGALTGSTGTRTLAIGGATATATPLLTLSPTTVGISGQVPTPASSTFTITNNSSSSSVSLNPLSVTNPSGGGSFTISSTCGSTLGPNASCTVTVTATPAGCTTNSSGYCIDSFNATIAVLATSGQISYSGSVSAVGNFFGGSLNPPCTPTPHIVCSNVVAFPSMPSPQSVSAGGTAQIAFQIAPVGLNYPGVVGFSASGLPPGATASFSPATIAQDSGPQTVVLSIATEAPSADLSVPHLLRSVSPVFLALLLLPPFMVGPKYSGSRARLKHLSVLFVVLIGGVLASGALIGCSSNVPPPATTTTGTTKTQSYQVTITATTGGVDQSITTTLTVE